MILLTRIGDRLFASFKKAFKDDKSIGRIPKIILENLHDDFNTEFKLPIWYDDKYLIINFKKVYFKASDKIFVKSIDRDSIAISYIVDEEKNIMELNMDIYPEKAKDINELITVLKVYNSFKKGTIGIGKTKIIKENKIKFNKELLEYIDFWEKVSLISKKTGIKFKPSERVTYKDEEVVKKLYRSFIEDKEYKEYLNIKKITVTLKNKFDKNDLENHKCKTIIFCRKDTFCLLDKEIELYGVIILFNLKIIDFISISKDNFIYDFFIESLDNNDIFKVVRYFKTKEEAERYKKTYCLDIKKLIDVELL